MAKSLLIITQKVDTHDQLLGFFVPWLNEFAKYYGRVTVLCLEAGVYSLPENVQVVSLGKDRGASKPAVLFNFYRWIIKNRNRYDSVFVHMNPIWVVLGGIPWHAMRKKIALWYTHKAVTLKLRLAVHGADTVFTASPESFRIPSRKVVVTGHGIDTEHFHPDPMKRRPGLHLLSVGRISPVKNYETLLRAARLLNDAGTEFTLAIVGKPALEADRAYDTKLKKLVREYGLDHRMAFLGKIDNRKLPELYQAHDLFVHLSKTGSLDKSILEAMACGMNVVSSNDASRAFLPATHVFREDSAADLVRAIHESTQHPHNFREYVVTHHDLRRLIETISRIV